MNYLCMMFNSSNVMHVKLLLYCLKNITSLRYINDCKIDSPQMRKCDSFFRAFGSAPFLFAQTVITLTGNDFII